MYRLRNSAKSLMLLPPGETQPPSVSPDRSMDNDPAGVTTRVPMKLVPKMWGNTTELMSHPS